MPYRGILLLTATLALPPPDPVGAGSVALVADDAEGGLDGGTLTGCFNLNIDSSLTTVN